MKCPYCGAEMEQGFLQSRGPIIWSGKKRLVKIPSRTKDIGLSEGGGVVGFYAAADYCRACNKMIIAPANP